MATAVVVGIPRRRTGYWAALLGIAVTTMVIASINRMVHVENISLLYLVSVIWLAWRFGSGPAFCAALLAFVAYDIFFIPPLYRVNVADPSEWVSLAALLFSGLVVGQLTGKLSQQTRQAIESQQHTQVLFELAQVQASGLAPDQLFATLVHHLITAFSSAGIVAGVLFLPGDDGSLWPKAVSQADIKDLGDIHLDAPEHLARAEEARRIQSTILLHTNLVGESILTCFVPLISSAQVVGVLGVSGGPEIAAIVPDYSGNATTMTSSRQRTFFAAFCNQLALAIEHTRLFNEAIQVVALREADRMKTALLGSVTHDLRTPLAAIQTAAGSLLLPETQWSDRERTELASLIVISADRLARLVDNLLALSRIEAGSAPTVKNWYPIEEVLGTVLAQMEQAGRLKDHPVQLSMPDTVVMAPIDNAQIERVLLNLIENAAKYSPPGSPIEIKAQHLPDSETIEIRVVDHGIGIPESQQTAIFDKFFRLQQPLPWAPNHPPIGTGLGLAIVANLVHEHGGRIWVEDTPGGGATFVFTLPAPSEPNWVDGTATGQPDDHGTDE